MSNTTQRAVAPRKSFRERNREHRRRDLLITAMDVVSDHGVAALTMKRVTEDIGCSEGLIYQHFPTKGALIAAMQAEAIRTLRGSLRAGQATLDRVIDERGFTDRVAALARVLGVTRFWVAADDVFPREMELTRTLLAVPDKDRSREDRELVVKEILEFGYPVFDLAVEAGALNPGDGAERTVVALISIAGVMMAARTLLDSTSTDPRLIADGVLTAQLLHWGADPAELAKADDAVRVLVDEGKLISPIGD